VDVVDLAIASMSGSTSQPNLNSIAAALQNTPRDTMLDLNALNEFSDYWEQVRTIYTPFDTSPKSGSAEVYLHEMPGGQYTNLKEQAASMGLSQRWPEIARTYSEVNQLFGDIVKVTPSSKVVGDMTMFLVTRGIRPADVVNLEPGTSFPESVIDMLSGGLGIPMGGWPKKVQEVVLGSRKAREGRPGEGIPPLNFQKVKTELAGKLKREVTDDDLFSHLMYPEVFAEFAKFSREYSDVSVIPTHPFFFGLKPGEEMSVDIEAGKTLFVKLINIGAPDKDGYRMVLYELNGMPREAAIHDRTLHIKAKARAKADAGDPMQIGAPIPGLITSVDVSPKTRVAKGAKVVTLEAMKMQTTIYAPADGLIDEIHIQAGDTVEARDLLVTMRE
jgi:pyruvate carboxylase